MKKILRVLFCFLLFGNIIYFAGDDLKANPVVKEKFAAQQREKFSDIMKSYPWEWANNEIVDIFIKVLLFPREDFSKMGSEHLSAANKNYIAIYNFIWKIIREGKTKEESLSETESETDNESTKHDLKAYISQPEIGAMIEFAENSTSQDWNEFLGKIPNYTKVVKLEKGEEFPRKDMTQNEQRNYLYGLYSTNKNAQAGLYINQKGGVFPISLKPAQTVKELFSVEKDSDLQEALDGVLAETKQRFDKTQVIPFKGTSQDAVIQYGKDQKTALVHFADGKSADCGAMFGKMSQGAINIHCIAGLYQSLQKDHLNEVQICDELQTIKYVRNGVFYVVSEPRPVTVLSVPGIDFRKNPNKEQAYKSIEFFIKQALISAIKSGCDNIILGKYNCGIFNAEPKMITDIIKKYLKLIQGKIKFIILPAGDKEPYSDY